MYFNQFLKDHRADYDVLLCDIDGTLVRGASALPGAPELIAYCRETKLPFFLLTNDSNHSLEEKSAIINRAGLDITPDEIISAGSMLTAFARSEHLEGRQFFVMGKLGTPCFAEKAGLKVCRDPEQIDDCAGVIVGEGRYDWQPAFHAAFNFFIKYPDRPLLAPNPDSYWPGKQKGWFGIGAGAQARFVCALLKDRGIHKAPHYFGKPFPDMYHHALKLAGAEEVERAIMLGDSLTGDIAGANVVGIASAVVLTGITTAEMAENAPPREKPQRIFNALLELKIEN